MNYYPFHIGDYVCATRHLSWEEDAAYRRLLDTYYTTEKPLPADVRTVCRLVLATTDSQREAVGTVLQEFFELTADGWRNLRADAEIDAMRQKQQKQRDKANKRWQTQRTAPGNAQAMPRHQAGDAVAPEIDADAMPPTPTPTPTPKENQLPCDREPRSPRPTRKCPDSFEVVDRLRQWAAEQHPTVDIDAATAEFRDHTFRTAISDWDGAWRNWIRRVHDYRSTDGPRAGGRPKPATPSRHHGISTTDFSVGVSADGRF